MRWIFVFVALISLITSNIAFSKEKFDFVIHPETLHQSLDKKGLVIVDLRKPESYAIEHIPNAINIPLANFHRKKGEVDGFIITLKSFQQLLESHGIRNSDQVVLYSDWAHLDTARVYWAFDFYGHSNIQILDGGFQAWQDFKLVTSNKKNTLPPSSYVVQVQTDKMATKFQTFMASHNANDYLIIDARPSAQYVGEKSLTDRKGHIPAAINIPWYSVIQGREEVDGYDHTNKVAMMDWQALTDKISSIPKNKKIILYCNGGQESSILYLGFKELGLETSVYDGSWFEWSDDKKMPVKVIKQ